MSYTPNSIITIDDTSPIDAFARLRFSQPTTLFDSKQLFDSSPLFFDDAEVSGSGTTTAHSVNRASTTIGVSASTAGRRVRRTKQRRNYQPGKSHLGLFTFVMGTNVANVAKRVGLFDDNNGVFFEMDGTTPTVVIRSFATGASVDTKITQANWNVDKMDGTGKSGITLDFTKAQILFIDFEWLGAGGVRYGFFIDGLPYIVHRQANANTADSVYMSTPNLPVAYEIENSGTGGASTLEHICSSVVSEGGFDGLGVVRSIDRGNSKITSSNNDIRAMVSIRLKSTHIGATIIPLGFNILASIFGGIDSRWAVYINPTFTGTDNASWVPIANSAVEYDITRDSGYVITGGTMVASGYFNDQNTPFAAFEIPSVLRLGSSIASDRDELVLAVGKVDGGGTEEYFGGISWQELL